MGGKASTASKNKYNAKAYDRIALVVPKGEKEKIQVHAQSIQKSVNSFINEAIQEAMQRDVSTTDSLSPKKESLPAKEKLVPSIISAQQEETDKPATRPDKETQEERDLLPWEEEG